MTYNCQQLQAGCLTRIAGPIFGKLYPNDHDRTIEGLEHHMLYFNTESCQGATLLGMVVAPEENLTNDDPGEMDISIIAEIETALMGPLVGIDDTVWAGLIKPIILSVTLGRVMQGYVWGTWAYDIGVTLLDFAVAHFTFMRGYQLDTDPIDRFLGSGFVKKTTTLLGIVGPFCLGAMIIKCVSIGTVLEIEMKTGTLGLGGVTNKIFPCLLSLVTILSAYWLQVKGKKVTAALIVLLVIGFIDGAVGLLGQKFFERNLTILSYMAIIDRKFAICSSCIPAREEKASYRFTLYCVMGPQTTKEGNTI